MQPYIFICLSKTADVMDSLTRILAAEYVVLLNNGSEKLFRCELKGWQQRAEEDNVGYGIPKWGAPVQLGSLWIKLLFLRELPQENMLFLTLIPQMQNSKDQEGSSLQVIQMESFSRSCFQPSVVRLHIILKMSHRTENFSGFCFQILTT